MEVFHFSPKRVKSLKLVQQVLNVPELKVVKPSDMRWLAHERSVQAVKASNLAIVSALNSIYEDSHEPEAVGLSKALSKKSTVAAISMLNYVLPQVAKLSRTLQTENLDLSVIACMVDTTLHTLDDAIQPAANWVLELLEKPNSFKELGITLTSEDIADFLDRTVKPFVTC